ncbi:nitrite/sulfite reductase [Anaerosporobacter faecicola]|uniref:nitrite/sulfite reductase n=1 Tax=Anaerosporobacter faecicola TaxID=2718714 RepID=UPI00143AB99F|nr:nitrite/sulfite reductase [Anaerosporobacter faecicola]
MQKEYIDEFKKDLTQFHEATRKFYQKELSVAEYKSLSGGFGSYAQRGGERSMLRLRLAGGEINKENLAFIANSIEKYEIDMAHFTTCQSLQLHNLTEQTVCNLIEEAFHQGIITRGGGGDYPRNVMCAPLSGVEEGEAFDVLPYAKEAADYLLGLINTVKLPRKLKVCFVNTKKNETHATFRDLGFVAKENHMFDVYAAGGLGNKPKMGLLVAQNIAPTKIIYCIKTMVDVFTAHGNYTNRAASRTRFLQDTLGVEGFISTYQEQLRKNLETEDLDISVTESMVSKTGTKEITGPRLVKQKQSGLYAVSYYPIGGNPKPGFFCTLYDTIKDMEEVNVRITPDQGIYIINLNAEEAKKVLAITEDGANTEFERSTACVGATICQVGIGKSQLLLDACVKRVREENFADHVLPAIHISGCPSSCSAHQIGALGFRGGKKPTIDGPKFAFAVYENGCERIGQEQFGTDLGVMLEEEIPEFLVDLGKAVQSHGLTYDKFREEYPEELGKIAAKYI